MCSGSLVLAAAGLLEGQRATSHWSTLPLLKPFGVTPVGDERIVRTGHAGLVTAAGVSAGIDLGLWLAGQIAGEERAKAIQLSIEYDPQPPFDSGHMSKASAATKATATAGLAKDTFKPSVMAAGAKLLWHGALATARRRGTGAGRSAAAWTPSPTLTRRPGGGATTFFSSPLNLRRDACGRQQ